MRTTDRFAFPVLALVIFAFSACGGSGIPSDTVPGAVSRQNDIHPSALAARTIALSPNDTLTWQPLSGGPDTAVPPRIMNAFVSLSAAPAGVPCFNCVHNPPVAGAYGIAFAQPYMARGSFAEETYTFEDISVTATCTLVFKIVQNGTVLATYQFTRIGISPGFFLFFHASTLPSNAAVGPATISANMLCPNTNQNAITESVFFH